MLQSNDIYLDEIEQVMLFISIAELAFDIKPSVRKEALLVMARLLDHYKDTTFRLNKIFTADELEQHIEAT